VAAALSEAGAVMADVVRVRYILSDRKLFPRTWPALKKWFGDVRPAATMMQAQLLEDAMLFEVEVTAHKPATAAAAPGS